MKLSKTSYSINRNIDELPRLSKELLDLVNKDKVTDINLPPTNEFVTNSRQQKLHVRTFLPANPKAIVFGLHGYSVHSNNPLHGLFGREFNKLNIGYVTFDFHGHGYSDGHRFYVEKYDHLVDDVLCVIASIYGKGTQKDLRDTSISLDDHGLPFQVKQHGFRVPFFVLGQSMGGAVALTVCISLNRLKLHGSLKTINSGPTLLAKHFTRDIGQYFSGCIAVCPAVKLYMPPPFIRAVIKHVVAPLFPQTPLPESLRRERKDALVPQQEILHRYRTKDSRLSDMSKTDPGALSCGQPIQFGTAESIVAMGDYIRQYLFVCSEHCQNVDFQVQEDMASPSSPKSAAFRSIAIALFVLGLIVHLLLTVSGRWTMLGMETSVQHWQAVLTILIVLLWKMPNKWLSSSQNHLAPVAHREVFDFPLLVFHDPQDETVPYSASQFLFEHLEKMRCITKPNTAESKSKSDVSLSLISKDPFQSTQKLVDVPEGMHDLYSSSQSIILDHAIPFIDDILKS